jgi:glycosyltransferase involved in cell wall biosynthesis
MDKVKILRITPTTNRGSISRTGEQLGKLVKAEGWVSYIAYSRPGNKSESNLIRVGNKVSLFFHLFLARAFDMSGFGSYFPTKRLVKKIERINPSLIHLHNIHSYDINISVLFRFLSKSNIPIVWSQHDCWAYTGHCTHYAKIKCEKWKTMCEHCPQLNRYPKSWFWDGSKRNFLKKKELFTSVNNMYIVAVSEWIRKELTSSFFKKYPIRRIYNGIDTKVFVPRQDKEMEIRNKYELGDKQILIGVAAAWGGKGISDYIKLNSIIDDNYVIVLVGVSEQLKETLPSSIKCIKRTDSMAELSYLYSAAAVCLNLSLEESFGKTTPEALACGTPCIVYNSTASPELVDECTGVVVSPGDVKGIYKAIKTIEGWDIATTKVRCRERARDLFDMDNNYKEYINLYKEILHVD